MARAEVNVPGCCCVAGWRDAWAVASGELRYYLSCEPVHRLFHMTSSNGQPDCAGGEPCRSELPEIVGYARRGGSGAAERPPR
jgi:hypothetical protein